MIKKLLIFLLWANLCEGLWAGDVVLNVDDGQPQRPMNLFDAWCFALMTDLEKFSPPVRYFCCGRNPALPQDELFWSRMDALHACINFNGQRDQVAPLIDRHFSSEIIVGLILDYTELYSPDLWSKGILAELPKQGDVGKGYFYPIGNPNLFHLRLGYAALLYLTNEMCRKKQYYYRDAIKPVLDLIGDYFKSDSKYCRKYLTPIEAAFDANRLEEMQTLVLKAVAHRLPYFISETKDHYLQPHEKAQLRNSEAVFLLADLEIAGLGDKGRQFERRMKRVSVVEKSSVVRVAIATFLLQGFIAYCNVKGEIPWGFAAILFISSTLISGTLCGIPQILAKQYREVRIEEFD